RHEADPEHATIRRVAETFNRRPISSIDLAERSAQRGIGEWIGGVGPFDAYGYLDKIVGIYAPRRLRERNLLWGCHHRRRQRPHQQAGVNPYRALGHDFLLICSSPTVQEAQTVCLSEFYESFSKYSDPEHHAPINLSSGCSPTRLSRRPHWPPIAHKIHSL